MQSTMSRMSSKRALEILGISVKKLTEESKVENMTGTNMNGPAAARTTSDSTPTTDRLAAKAHETIERVAESAVGAEHRVRERASDAAGKMRETEQRARQTADQSVAKVSDYVQQNPLLSAGIAFAAGALLSGMLRR
jgi:ElaB/YqjD/DUF883 family membrane-anchored ribosome-binding protein